MYDKCMINYYYSYILLFSIESSILVSILGDDVVDKLLLTTQLYILHLQTEELILKIRKKIIEAFKKKGN